MRRTDAKEEPNVLPFPAPGADFVACEHHESQQVK